MGGRTLRDNEDILPSRVADPSQEDFPVLSEMLDAYPADSAQLPAMPWRRVSTPASPAPKPVLRARTPASARVAEMAKCIRTDLDCSQLLVNMG